MTGTGASRRTLQGRQPINGLWSTTSGATPSRGRWRAGRYKDRAGGQGGALAAPPAPLTSTTGTLLPLGQMLWMKELMSYKEFPPLQAPETYNLDGIIAEMKAARTASHVGE